MNFAPNITVTWTHTNIALKEAFEQACMEVLGYTYLPTITSGNSGTHSPQSGHFYNRALDFRSRDMPEAKKAAVLARALEILGDGHWGTLEVHPETKHEHFHLQRNKNSF